jgi:TolA-binding protein
MKHLILAVSIMGAFAAVAPSHVAAQSKAAEPKHEYVKKVRAEIDELSGKIDALELRVKKTGVSAHKDMDRKIKKLKGQRKMVKNDLAKLKRASSEAWADLKASVDKGIEDLKKELDEIGKD